MDSDDRQRYDARGHGPHRAGPAPADGRPGGEGFDDAVLAKVRALLAKAESTTFEAEAMAFTAKAQELITRHAIDHALLDGDGDGNGNGDGTGARGGGPAGRTVPVEQPYARAKALLLAVIADANRCRAVWLQDAGTAQVFGFGPELDAVELLFTSLLLQATSGMLATGPRHDPSGRSRTRSFRQAFLLGFATRIGTRLDQAADAGVAEAERARGPGSVLPVLADREAAVEEAVRDAFPTVVRRRSGASNRDGWFAGQAAAERATLSTGRPVTTRSGGRR